ncbi:hypothetical protein BB8028_0001g09510 [Beauveria bassiana]|uniref:Uncharacterized protein n=1 Tax=Beauveria bassiana TaxID=176275 RepID=A0A2S7XYJ7_BEABA|nr:hypothetical protein BB8028_0001g09510 [Beauveria bassiana]
MVPSMSATRLAAGSLARSVVVVPAARAVAATSTVSARYT